MKWPLNPSPLAHWLRPWHDIGRAGQAAVVVMALALAWALWGQPALQAQVQELDGQTRLLRAEVLRRASAQTAAAARAPMPAQAFAQAFANEADRSTRTARLLEGARQRGLQWTRSEGRATPDPTLGLVRDRVVLPLQGRYADLLAFLATALAQDAALSLDRLVLRRDTEGDLLQAEMTFTLYSKAAP